MALLFVVQSGCRTAPPLPATDLSEGGWTVRMGQAVWRPRRQAPELAGELLVATHRDGRTFVQFTKTPFPVVWAWTTSTNWQIYFAPHDRARWGRGKPAGRSLWLHLARCLNGAPAPRGVWLTRGEDSTWRLGNPVTGETLEGFLRP